MLTSILLRLVGWLGGGVFDTLIGRVADHLRQKASDDLVRFQTGVQADTQIALAQLNAQIEARKLQAQIMEADRGWWVTSFIRPLIVYPCVLHFSAIVLDSTFMFGWGIAKLPPPYDGYEQAIILSFFIARPFEKVARVFAAGRT
ncbi:hypothetical protein [Pseudorhodoplanes sinuspersici]|uniref:Uncharacterized protein n=1 Tax=Pseudorhodoplanes sinuspersici TaxID=1235591 RepID=A0A1W6ZW26_9HYPH|nr:hypothetical protein [Pseudorhodoplanes sinuspersici]ARQ00965.1 hypothetical protein CAK95_19105 [Pseudorhodoplanes sinuspersici]RKE72600.1 hypothetical protein DFP91_0468 [Pseudorhodoplanes sinuspersici]